MAANISIRARVINALSWVTTVTIDGEETLNKLLDVLHQP
jgi:hypothetical protein